MGWDCPPPVVRESVWCIFSLSPGRGVLDGSQLRADQDNDWGQEKATHRELAGVVPRLRALFCFSLFTLPILP